MTYTHGGNPYGLDSPEQLQAATAEGARKDQIAAQNRQLRVRAMQIGHAVGLPVEAAVYIVTLEARIAQLEHKVAALQGPPHLQSLEQR